MPKASRYRLLADECILVANNVRDKVEKKILRNIAEQYRRLANHKTKTQQRTPTQPASSVAIAGEADVD